MKVLVTGGTGVVGKSAVDHLLRAGHEVRLLSRHAAEDARQWASGVEPWPGDVSSDGGVRGACHGCHAVLHVAGIVAEHPPEATFRNVNVEGTRRLAQESRRAGVARFVYVSSLGAAAGASAYHRSKAEAEEAVRATAPSGWLIVRPGNVYGPGDEVISFLLKMVRVLPVIPLVGRGDQPFQPVWVDDLGLALARAVERDEPRETALDLAGPEVTTTREVIDLLEKLTDRTTLHVPVPEALARLGTRAAEALGVDFPVKNDQITMLLEENVIPAGRPNALTDVFGVTPLTLAEGLGKLVDALPEALPQEGTGTLEEQRYRADGAAPADAEALLGVLRDAFAELAPEGLVEVGAEPGSGTRLDVGETLTLALPMRGHVQVRVQEVGARHVTLVTLEGHPLSGAIRFGVEPGPGGAPTLEVRSVTRSSDLVDLIGMRTVGKVAQKATWTTFLERWAERAGLPLTAGGARTETRTLEGEEARAAEAWVREVVMRRKRDENPAG